MSTDNEQWLQRYLDGELSEEEERIALHLIADDPEMRSMLKFDLQLRQGLSGEADAPSHPDTFEPEAGSIPPVPEQFFEGVMDSISKLESGKKPSRRVQPTEAGAKTGTAQKIGAHRKNALLNWLFHPRTIEWRPAWSAGIAALLLVAITAPFFLLTTTDTPSTQENPTLQIVEQTTDRVMIRFVYLDNEAESIEVAGDFSDWEPIPLSRQVVNGDHVWTGIVPLTRGEHRYMFIKDGELWTTDPLAHRHVEDGFGNRNAIIHL
ncbi:glycogen-binding domain-containing protein [Balneolales bacterium ANBcel1]|nr:glycogen-binding domain-containing protein [Balneolales bacterium ANBcel1]